jgi:hypothetical protein
MIVQFCSEEKHYYIANVLSIEIGTYNERGFRSLVLITDGNTLELEYEVMGLVNVWSHTGANLYSL